MQRISTATAVPDLFGGGKPGFTDGDPAGGIPTTFLNAAWFNQVQEELANAVEDDGLALNAGQRDQLSRVIARLATTDRAGRVELATREEARLQARADLAVSPVGLADYQQRLVANFVMFVRADGNDGNSGLVNTPTGAFRTIQRAIDQLKGLTGAGFAATVNVGAGGFPDFSVAGLVGLPIRIVGAGRSSTLVSGSTSRNAVSVDAGSTVTIGGVGFADLGNSGVVVGNGGLVILNNVKFFAANGRHIWAEEGGAVQVVGAVEIVGGAVSFATAGIASRITMSGQTVSVFNNPTFTSFFDATSGTIRARSMTFSGQATGRRYTASVGGAIDVGGAGPDHLPGSTAGTAIIGFYA